MHPFPDCATATFVVCCSERVAPVVLSRQQNALLRRGRYKQGSSRRQERTCLAIWIVPSQAEPIVSPMQANFARRFVGARTYVPWQPPRTKSKPRQQRDQSLTTTKDGRSP